ncbi:AtpZ/AtpI family protein [Flavobacteriaceae bacterium F08102]|nr:AtpZ/AtpI family protein [Flavobacteriaceae bacterium F08102]
MDKENQKKQLRLAAQFTGIAFQMGAAIFVASYFGNKLDAHYGHKKNVFTLIFILIAMGFSIWSILRQLKKMNKKD